MAGEDEDWRRLLEQYLPPPDPRRDLPADPAREPGPVDDDPDDTPWRVALRDAARSGLPAGGREGRARKRTPPADPAPPAEIVAAGPPGLPHPPGPPAQVGQRVAIRSLRGLRGTVREVRGAQAQVETEAGRVWVALSALVMVTEELGHDLPPAISLPRRSVLDPALHGDPVVWRGGKRSAQHRAIDLHGMLLSEALERLDAFLYASWDAAYPTIAVVHGKGTGTLRDAVRGLLADHPAVQHCTSASPREGGEGVTIATLYRR